MFSIAQLEEGETCPEHVKLGVPWGEDSFAIHMIFPAGILGEQEQDTFLRAGHVEAFVEQLIIKEVVL